MKEQSNNVPETKLKSPWGSGTIIATSLITSFLAGGILTGINWRRMGKPHLMWPAILGTGLIFFLYIFLVPDFSSYFPLDLLLILLINLIVVLPLWWWQRATYIEWKKTRPNALKAGYQIPVLVVVVMTVVTLVWMFI